MQKKRQTETYEFENYTAEGERTLMWNFFSSCIISIVVVFVVHFFLKSSSPYPRSSFYRIPGYNAAVVNVFIG